MKKNKLNNSRLLLIIVLLFVILCFIIYYYATKDNVFSKYKSERGKNIVYPIYQKDKISVPYINLKGTAIDEVNKIIVDKANDFLVDKNRMSYTFNINGKILSLAIQYIDFYNEDKNPIIYYDVYNINFYTSEVLGNQDMLGLYGITEADVKPIVESKFREFYNDEMDKKMFNNECDYNCFLAIRGIENNNYMDGAYYYIKEGNLYVLKSFKIYSPFGEENYFTTKDFLIQITE